MKSLSMMRSVCLASALAALFILPATSRAEESGISDWGVNDATYGLKTRESESGFSYTPSPADWRDINIYQLFTDRFADSGTDQLASYKASWKCDSQSYPYNRNFHHGGDWNGLRNNIPYLTGMGVKAVWISGVQMNDQGKDTRYTPYHQYHPDNFFKCDPAMGTFAELKQLIDALHAAGIYVILDVAPNHMCDKNGLSGDADNYYNSGGGTLQWWNESNKHPAPFDNLAYFHNNGTIQCWDCDPENKKGQFKGTDDLNTDNGDSGANAAVQDILAKAFKNLIDATDCDGFRVDAIKHVDYTWIRNWADAIRDHAAYRGKNDFIMFGELFSYSSSALASYCSDGYGFNSALFFPISQTIKGVFGDGNWTGYLGQTMNEVSQYGVGANRLVAFIDNHDLNRISLQISGTDTGNAEWKLKPAMSFLYLATPVPCLYYGTEHAFNQGGHYNGSNKTTDNPDDGDWQRECMFDKGFQPGAATGNKLVATNAPLYLHIAWLNELRDSYVSLRRGTFSQLCYSGGQGQYVFKKTYGEQTAVVYLNTSDSGITTDSANVGLPNTTFYDADNTNNVKVSNGSGYLPAETLSGKGTKVYVNQLPSGPVESLWCSGTYAWPASGDATTTNLIYVNTEAGPTSLVTAVDVIWSSNGTTWNETAMTVNTNWASTGGHWYNAALGPFAASTNLQYVIRVANGTNLLWDNNNNANFSVSIKAAASIGLAGTYNYPTVAKASENLYVNTLVTAATNPTQAVVTIFVSTDGGVNWSSSAMDVNTNWTDSRGIWFNADLGQPTAGAVLKYYVAASNVPTAEVVVDNNGGSFYTVNVAAEQAQMVIAEATPDMAGEVFDLVTTGGAAITQGTNGFGDFGSIYVNYDANYLYLGAASVAMPTDVDNNAYAVFVSAGTNQGADNVWYVNSAPDGLDRLHNVGFGPAVQCAILLGDVYGDANHTNFGLYHSEGPDFGQGVFAMPHGTSGDPKTFSGVAGAKIVQFGAYGYNHQQASSWKAAIPLSFFGATNAQALGNVYLSGLMISINTNNGVNSYLSGKFLGESCICPNTNEQPDVYGNFGTSYVTLTGLRCSVPVASNDTFGVPADWVADFEADATGHVFTANSDFDADGLTDRQEYFVGTDPLHGDDLRMDGFGEGWLRFYRGDGNAKNCTYVLQAATNMNAAGTGWVWRDFQTTTTASNALPLPASGASNVMLRIRVAVPGVDEPADSVNVGALPAGGNFSTETLNVTLNVSGYNVTASTYSLGASPLSYSNGQVIVLGEGMTNGQTRTLTMYGETLHGVTTNKTYVFTKTEAGLPIAWTGNVVNDPAAGSLDAGEALTVGFQTAPIGAAASAGIVYTSNGGSSWSSGALAKGTPTSSNDVWTVDLGSFAAGTTIQYALVAYDDTGSNVWNNNSGANYSIAVNGGGSTNGNGKFTPYSTNPTKGLYRSAGIAVDGANTGGEWTTNMLIAIDMVNDDPRSLGSNWTMHEPPADVTHLWACWDDTKLYLAWQFVDVTDKLDPANAGSALGGRISNSSGILQFISIDTLAGAGAPSNMWAKNDRMVGTDLPDYQIGMRSDLYSSFISKSLDGVFAGDSQLGTNYFTTAAAGISIARAAGCASATLYGPYSDVDNYLANTNSSLTEYVSSGHDVSRDSFYEMSIPFTALGIDKATLEANGVGVFINVGSKSSLDTIPNDAATLNTPGVTDSNSSWEWEDSDQFTAGYARVAK